MRPFQTLLKLMLIATVAFDLGGGAWAMRAMVDRAQTVDPASHAPQAMPCHGDLGGEPAIATPHDHADTECGSADCDCGCAVTSAAPPMPGVAPALAAPDTRRAASSNEQVPDDFALPGLRPPISA